MLINAISHVNSIVFTVNEKLIFKCKLINDISSPPQYKLVLENKTLSTIKTKWKFPLKIYFEIEIYEQKLKLQPKGTIFRPFYILNYKEEDYEIYLHKKPQLSIYKNNKQIASIESNYKGIIFSHKITTSILFEKDKIDITLICSIFSALEFPKNEGLSKMFFEKRKFNSNWMPEN